MVSQDHQLPALVPLRLVASAGKELVTHLAAGADPVRPGEAGGAHHESIPPAYVAWWAATSNRVVLPVLLGLQIRAMVFVALGPEFKRIPAQQTQLDLRLSYGSVHNCL